MFGSRVLCSWAKVYANLSETHICLYIPAKSKYMQTWVWTVLKFMDTIIWAKAFLNWFLEIPKKCQEFEATIGFSTCSANLPSQVVSDATWSAFNGRLAAVSEGQAYFSSVHRVHRAKTSLARTLRQLCQAHPELTLFAAEEFCTKALAEVGGEFWGGNVGRKSLAKTACIYLQHNLRWENIVDNYVPHHWNPVHTLETSTIWQPT